jgi:hypothetical protein
VTGAPEAPFTRRGADFSAPPPWTSRGTRLRSRSLIVRSSRSHRPHTRAILKSPGIED